jgi:undecaprenyl-diphosphatase
MPEFLRVVLLGIIEGITEFLPISSTGHLLVAERWLGERSETFNVVIQAGAILAVALIYRQRLWQLATNFHRPDNRDYALKLIAATAITCALSFIAIKLGFKLKDNITPIAWAFIVGGLWMLAAEHFAAKLRDSTTITWTVAILVGLAQVVAAIFPGTSRSAATIFVAMLAGASNRPAATEFAFLVGIPTMFAASGYELLKAMKTGEGHEDWGALALGFIVSMIVGFVAVKWLLGFIRTHRFTPFALYRIVLGAALLLMIPAGT